MGDGTNNTLFDAKMVLGMRASAPHPQVQQVLQEMADADMPLLTEMSVEQARTMLGQPFVDDPEPVEDVRNRTLPGPAGEIPVRIYRPDDTDGLPVVTFFHGGGFVIGDLDSHDPVCRALANAAGVVVVSVDYRRAPEHPFPAAVEDGYAATKWVADNAASFGGDPDRLAVAGDSAGGNLAAAVTLLARDKGDPDIEYQVLIYPTVSYEHHWPSHDLTENVLMTAEESAWMSEKYIQSDIHAKNPCASPIAACDHSDLPPATIISAGYDIICDEALAYADTLADAGVDVSHHHYDDMVHTFIEMLGVVDRAEEAMNKIAADLTSSLQTH